MEASRKSFVLDMSVRTIPEGRPDLISLRVLSISVITSLALERAADKALAWIGLKKGCASVRESITLKVEHKNVVVDLDDILYIEAMDNYVKVFRKGLPTVLSQITMKEMETLLPAARFIRVHRSYIVSLNAIDKFSNRKIFLYDLDRVIPVGRKYIESFNNLYDIFRHDSVDPS